MRMFELRLLVQPSLKSSKQIHFINKTGRFLCTLGLVALVAGCSKAKNNNTQADTKAATQPAPAPKKAPPGPGGMWMPQQMGAHAEFLKQLGATFDPKVLTDIGQAPVAAVVSLGGCSGSFVSPKGLIITNHHCATSALQFNSIGGTDLLANGFLAADITQEKRANPSARVFITTKFDEVTDEVLAATAKIEDPIAKDIALREVIHTITQRCETTSDQKSVQCSVVPFFGGKKYYQTTQLEILDVRLVHAPPYELGQFGGDIDNWRWPRHGNDYSFFRAYVGPDNQPADYHPNNRPYEPAHFLKVAQEPLNPNDFVMVAGYPGATHRLTTETEVREAVEFSLPQRIANWEALLSTTKAVVGNDRTLKNKNERRSSSWSNVLILDQGVLSGLQENQVLASKKNAEDEMKTWIAASPDRSAKYQDLFTRIADIRKEREKFTRNDFLLRSILSPAQTLIESAVIIVRMAEERQKPDGERTPEFQEHNWKSLEQRVQSLTKFYDENLDKTILKITLIRALEDPKIGKEFIQSITGHKTPDNRLIDELTDELYAGTRLTDEATRMRFFKMKPDELKAEKDPFLRFVAFNLGRIESAEKRQRVYDIQMQTVRPLLYDALSEKAGFDLASDANRTLRITYGQVRGFAPKKDAPVYPPFSFVSGLIEKSTKAGNQSPFTLTDAFKTAVQEKKFGARYLDRNSGEIPVDFLSTLDTTGGNSGSPTLNSRGELTGLLFDGNYEGVASDWVFLPDVTRSIHVDIRFVLWHMDAVAKAGWLLKEMEITPEF